MNLTINFQSNHQCRSINKFTVCQSHDKSMNSIQRATKQSIKMMNMIRWVYMIIRIRILQESCCLFMRMYLKNKHQQNIPMIMKFDNILFIDAFSSCSITFPFFLLLQLLTSANTSFNILWSIIIKFLIFHNFFLPQNFNTYTPSPSPYGNLGPSNISHTSSTLLMPQSSISSSSGTTGTPSLLSGSINPALILPPPSSHCATMTTGFGEFSFVYVEWILGFVGLRIEFLRAFGNVLDTCEVRFNVYKVGYWNF